MRIPAVLAIVCLASCQSYQEHPLLEEEMLRQSSLDTAPIAAKADGAELPYADFENLVITRSPELRQLRALANEAAAVAAVPTPFPNPTLSTGVAAGFDTEGVGRRSAGLIGINWDIPLDGRRGLLDDLHRTAALRAEVAVLARAEELKIDSREAVALAHQSEKKLQLLDAIAADSAQAAGLIKRLSQKGVGNTLDAALFETAARQDALAAARCRQEAAAARSRLGALAAQPLISAIQAPATPAQGEDKDAHARILKRHPAIARHRAAFVEAEARLRLEIRKQYPTLQLGSAFGGEPGSDMKRLDLTLGVSLPIFDRNQPAIAAAAAARESRRQDFQAALDAALAALAGRQEECRAAAFACDEAAELATAAEAALKLARSGFEAGAVDHLRLLEAGRALRQARLQLAEAEAARANAELRLAASTGG